MDPRVKTPPAALAQTHVLAMALFDDIARDSAVVAQVRSLRDRLREAGARTNDPESKAAVATYDTSLSALTGQTAGGRRGGGGRGRGGAGAEPSLGSIDSDLLTMLALLEEADTPPTAQALAAVRVVQSEFAALLARWDRLRTTDLAALNSKLRAAGQQAVSISP
jgi:hypothetical protein